MKHLISTDWRGAMHSFLVIIYLRFEFNCVEDSMLTHLAP